jgi:hypothetical protein
MGRTLPLTIVYKWRRVSITKVIFRPTVSISVNLNLQKGLTCLSNYRVFESSISRGIYTIERNTSIVNIFTILVFVSSRKHIY